ncbi:aspartate kinase [Thalassotalea maritima]|uniref:aspartate kinase n=1 Tax=Thalassotalea maritima TaxID=3242416 RepID=UPI003528D36E
MAIIVQKFGGTSVGSPSRIEQVADTIIATKNQGHEVVVVVSAMAGETNRLQSLANDIDDNPSARELDMLLSSGEQVTTALLAMALIKRGYAAISLLGHQAGIYTNNRFTKARIKDIDCTRMLQELQQGHVVIVAGFQGVDREGNITTLGRGGSDTSAVAIAAALQAKECQIFTDVDGVYTTDPRIDSKATKLKHISFDEMLELASCGAKVLQSRSVEFAGQNKMPLRVLSSFESGSGTQIRYEDDIDNRNPVTAVAALRDEILVNVRVSKESALIRNQLFNALAAADVEIDMISDFDGENFKDLKLTMARKDLHVTSDLLSTLQSRRIIDAFSIRDELTKVSIVGNGMKSHSGVAADIFNCLHDAGVDIHLISTSEIKVSVLIKQQFTDVAVKALTQKFNLNA